MNYRKKKQSGDYFSWLDRKKQKRTKRRIRWVCFALAIAFIFLSSPHLYLKGKIAFLDKKTVQKLNNISEYVRLTGLDDKSTFNIDVELLKNHFLFLPISFDISSQLQTKERFEKLDATTLTLSSKFAFTTNKNQLDTATNSDVKNATFLSRGIALLPGEAIEFKMLSKDAAAGLSGLQFKVYGQESTPTEESWEYSYQALDETTVKTDELKIPQRVDPNQTNALQKAELQTPKRAGTFRLKRSAQNTGVLFITGFLQPKSLESNLLVMAISKLEGELKKQLPKTLKTLSENRIAQIISDRFLPVSTALHSPKPTNDSTKDPEKNLYAKEAEIHITFQKLTHSAASNHHSLPEKDLLFLDKNSEIRMSTSDSWQEFFSRNPYKNTTILFDIQSKKIPLTWKGFLASNSGLFEWIGFSFLSRYLKIDSEHISRLEKLELASQIDDTMQTIASEFMKTSDRVTTFIKVKNNGKQSLHRFSKGEESTTKNAPELPFGSLLFVTSDPTLTMPDNSKYQAEDFFSFAKADQLILELKKSHGSALNADLRASPNSYEVTFLPQGLVFTNTLNHWRSFEWSQGNGTPKESSSLPVSLSKNMEFSKTQMWKEFVNKIPLQTLKMNLSLPENTKNFGLQFENTECFCSNTKPTEVIIENSANVCTIKTELLVEKTVVSCHLYELPKHQLANNVRIWEEKPDSALKGIDLCLGVVCLDSSPNNRTLKLSMRELLENTFVNPSKYDSSDKLESWSNTKRLWFELDANRESQLIQKSSSQL